MRISIVIGLLILSLVFSLNAAGNVKERRSEALFQGAKRCFRVGQWATAAAWFKEYIASNPTSPQRNKATLYRAQALFRLKQYRECFNELKNAEDSSGLLAAEYKFWMAECRYREAGDTSENEGLYRVAAQLYAEVPKSDRFVEANISEAMAHARLKDWPKVVELLQPSTGAFQKFTSKDPSSSLSLQGRLILAEALLKQNLHASATRILNQLEELPLAEEDIWRHKILFSHALLAQNKNREALDILQELLHTSENRMPQLRAAQAIELKLLAHKELKQYTEAANTCRYLWQEGMPDAVRQRGLLLAIQLAALNETPFDISQLQLQSKSILKGDSYAAAQVTLGDILLAKEHQEKEFATQAIPIEGYRNLYQAATSSSFSGYAHKGLAWAAWMKEQYSESYKYFSQAATKLTNAEESNQALFKAIESAFLAGDLEGALNTGRGFLANTPSKKLLDSGVFLMLRAAIQKATNEPYSLVDARKFYFALIKNNLLSSEAVHGTLLLSRAESQSGNHERARELLMKISRDSSRKAITELESARVFISKNNWSVAIARYNAWLETHKSQPLGELAKVSFDLGWLYHLNNDFASAKRTFLSVVLKFPDTPEAARAHMWLADRSFSASNPDYVKAEEAYQKVRDIKNIPLTLRFRASLMAGRSALARGNFENAREYFKEINKAKECPKTIKAEAAFALSDVAILDSTKDDPFTKLNNTIGILESYLKSNNQQITHMALLAYGRIGDCHLQMAAKDPNRYLKAQEAYGRVIEISNQMDGDPPARYRAMIGMALSLKNIPEADSNKRTKNLIQALGWAKKVFEGATATESALNPFWVRESGMISAELQSLAGKPKEAIATYEALAHHYKKMKVPLNLKIDQIRQSIRESSSRNPNYE